MKYQVDYTNESLTPLSLLKISKKFSELREGDILEVRVSDKHTRDYILKVFLPEEVLSETSYKTGEGKIVFHIILKKEEKDDRFNQHHCSGNC